MPQWAKLTSDQSILDWASHYHIDFIDTVYPLHHTVRTQITFSETEQRIIDSELLKLFEKGVIEPSVPETDVCISTDFLHPEKDSNYRMIINLKRLNSFSEYHHFMMDTKTTAIKMTIFILKHAYYTVPIAQEHQKFLNFFGMVKGLKLPACPTC